PRRSQVDRDCEKPRDVLAVAGGGGAIAATHGSSHGTKPTVHKVVRQHMLTKAHVWSGHHCSHSASGASAL
ncbi:MAG TPA: hypothetical protein VIM18_15565, partial [Solirubrobacteraceae bacterium]